MLRVRETEDFGFSALGVDCNTGDTAHFHHDMLWHGIFRIGSSWVWGLHIKGALVFGVKKVSGNLVKYMFYYTIYQGHSTSLLYSNTS